VSSGSPPRHPSKEHEFALSADDLEALDSFCENFEFDDIPMDDWVNCQDNLDITFHLTLSNQQLAQGLVKTITFSRCVLSKTGSEQSSKEKVSHEIKIKPGSKPGMMIKVPGLGDCSGDKVGVLCIILQSE
jgi:hypothetical protein